MLIPIMVQGLLTLVLICLFDSVLPSEHFEDATRFDLNATRPLESLIGGVRCAGPYR